MHQRRSSPFVQVAPICGEQPLLTVSCVQIAHAVPPQCLPAACLTASPTRGSCGCCLPLSRPVSQEPAAAMKAPPRSAYDHCSAAWKLAHRTKLRSKQGSLPGTFRSTRSATMPLLAHEAQTATLCCPSSSLCWCPSHATAMSTSGTHATSPSNWHLQQALSRAS